MVGVGPKDPSYFQFYSRSSDVEERGWKLSAVSAFNSIVDLREYSLVVDNSIEPHFQFYSRSSAPGPGTDSQVPSMLSIL